jgi:uncharacterized protein
MPFQGVTEMCDRRAGALSCGARSRENLMAQYIFVLFVGVISGVLSGIIGTGSSIMLLPVLVFQFGPKQAVPMMAIAALMSNVAKVAAWWREVDWRAFFAYSLTGVPAAALGARTLLVLPARAVDVALGTFFLLMIPGRRWLHARNFRIRLWQLALAGAVIGFLTGIVISTGPLSVPAFTAYGLAKGAFISTEAASSLALFVSKVATFRQLGALPLPSIIQGVIIGASVMAGTFIGKAVVQRMSTSAFQHVLDALLLCSGLSLLWAALA